MHEFVEEHYGHLRNDNPLIYHAVSKDEPPLARIEVNGGQRRWQPRSPAMAAGLTDHIWTIEELLMAVAAPEIEINNIKYGDSPKSR